jgi:hypothetical protein
MLFGAEQLHFGTSFIAIAVLFAAVRVYMLSETIALDRTSKIFIYR